MTPEQLNIQQQNPNSKTVKYLRIGISWTLALIGVVILLAQLFPLTGSYIRGRVLELKEQIVAKPLPESYKQYIEGDFAYYDPGVSYFQNLIAQAGSSGQESAVTYDPETKTMKNVVIDKNYRNPMMLTIDAIGIEKVNVTPNVESYDEDVYNLYLKSGLAHFQGTPLPGDGGNSFIYGHSAVESFFSGHQNLPETIFTKLEDVDVGKEVIIQKDGQELVYKVRKKQIVDPDDFSILNANGNKETVTLMTCWPLGIGNKRLVVIAERNE